MGWIGVDLDKTLAHFDGKTYPGIGAPLKPMVDRVKGWISAGKTVKIFTARTGTKGQAAIIHKWLAEQGLPELEITNVKDHACEALYDDKARQVEANTGKLL